MRIFDVIRACQRLAAPVLFISLGISAAAQTPGVQGRTERPVVVQSEQPAPIMIARPSELECSGFIEHNPPSSRMEIVGGEEEQEQRVYGQGDYVYLNGGAQQSVKVGDEFSVVRPRGRFKSDFSSKSDSLGMYTQELGRVRVVSVKQNVSVAVVVKSCETILLGDLLRITPQKTVAVARTEEVLDRFAEPSGKQRGRIVLARDGREMVSKDQVVFIDLGTEDNVKPGDYLTVYRPVGTGNISRFKDKEVTPGASGGFESDIFRGGKYSTKAQRTKDPVNGSDRSNITTPDIVNSRPALPRKIVGEIVVISVEGRTAAAVITRTAQEIHTGDYVEVQ